MRSATSPAPGVGKRFTETLLEDLERRYVDFPDRQCFGTGVGGDLRCMDAPEAMHDGAPAGEEASTDADSVRTRRIAALDQAMRYDDHEAPHPDPTPTHAPR